MAGTPKKSQKPRRPWRDNLEAFSVAILMAVLLKPMILEAYQIPTPSMQPTLMGSPEAGVYDRILVDKARYLLFEPKRWDIAVFRYPIRRNQNYVKRIVGMPGDRLRIAGGNIYQVDEDGKAISGVRRKPDRIQERLWKEIYPARRYLADEPRGPLGSFSRLAGSWTEDGEDLVAEPSGAGTARLAFRGGDHSGLSNQIYDGYPTDVARAIMADPKQLDHLQGVQDVRFTYTITPEESPSLLRTQLRIRPPGATVERTMALEIKEGVARLIIAVGGEEMVASDTVACDVVANEATEIGFAHVDDRLIAWRNGAQVLELEVGNHRFTRPLDPGLITLSMQSEGGGPQRLSAIRIERDLHYQPKFDQPGDTMIDVLEHVLEVPEGHYFMMGDNTLASEDSRQWKAVTVGESATGKLVDPKTNPDSTAVRGNRRPFPLTVTPDTDENPVILNERDADGINRIAFTDEDGGVHLLTGKLSPNYAPGNMEFIDPDGHRWLAKSEHVFYVPREHILGRPLVTFWPLTRIGCIR